MCVLCVLCCLLLLVPMHSRVCIVKVCVIEGMHYTGYALYRVCSIQGMFCIGYVLYRYVLCRVCI